MRYLVTCICYGDSCDGHATKIGTANTLAEAETIIKDDMRLFASGIEGCTREYDEISNDDFTLKFSERNAEIWYDDDNGRVYDVHEI